MSMPASPPRDQIGERASTHGTAGVGPCPPRDRQLPHPESRRAPPGASRRRRRSYSMGECLWWDVSSNWRSWRVAAGQRAEQPSPTGTDSLPPSDCVSLSLSLS
mmetsp:Transcript_20001/g.20122  ORF Transcript_20001/g.20122 Transcript_20001/m.20122 type:complete len:104 (-) Transcript_20001:17-328(-)